MHWVLLHNIWDQRLYFPSEGRSIGVLLKDTSVLAGDSNPHSAFMALLTVSTESALMVAGNYVLTASVVHRLAANFGFGACELGVTRHSTLTGLAQKFFACTSKQGIMIVSTEFGGKQSQETPEFEFGALIKTLGHDTSTIFSINSKT